MALDISELRKLCIPKNIRITLHAAKRLEQRRIFLKDVIACIMNGEIIEQYPDHAERLQVSVLHPSGHELQEDLFPSAGRREGS